MFTVCHTNGILPGYSIEANGTLQNELIGGLIIDINMAH